MLPWLIVWIVVELPAPPETVAAIDREEADRGRIRAHLTRVEAELRARDTSHLPERLRRAREKNLDRLREYREAGRFPQNHQASGGRVPIFIDAEGTTCAVGHLVIDSGGMRIAQEIRAHENNARLAFMRHPELDDWIARSGLTAEEHAMIQPAYCGCSTEVALVCGIDGKTYANACYAETCAGVEIAHDGPCEGDGTGGWPSAGTDPSTDAGGSNDSGTSTGQSDDDVSTGGRPAGDGTTTGEIEPSMSDGNDDSETATPSVDPDDVEDSSATGCGCRGGGPTPTHAAAWAVGLAGLGRRRRA